MKLHSRVLTELAKEDLIHVEGKNITLLHPDQLQNSWIILLFLLCLFS